MRQSKRRVRTSQAVYLEASPAQLCVKNHVASMERGIEQMPHSGHQQIMLLSEFWGA